MMKSVIPILFTLVAATTAADLGSWNVQFSEDAGAAGWYIRDVVARYSGQDNNVTCHYADIPPLTSNDIPIHTDTCSDPSFNYTIDYSTAFQATGKSLTV